MSRSLWKGAFTSLKTRATDAILDHKEKHKFQFLRATLVARSNNNKQNIASRNSMILPKDIAKQITIYNGKSWITRQIIESMVGHKFGEFSFTKKKVFHKFNKRKQMSKRK